VPSPNEITSFEYLILEDNGALKQRFKPSKEVRRIFINQGAADTWGAIPELVRDLDGMEGDFGIKVLLGPSFKHHAEMKAALAGVRKPVEVHEKVDSPVSLMSDCDLAILGGGNTMFEALAIGMPVIGATREEKELITLSRLTEEGCIECDCRLYHGISIKPLVKRLLEDPGKRNGLFERNRSLFGYRGIDRILDLCEGSAT
jgi:spore coat polysaccharide biosynthesis predicted glycosyltransferase SpsG